MSVIPFRPRTKPENGPGQHRFTIQIHEQPDGRFMSYVTEPWSDSGVIDMDGLIEALFDIGHIAMLDRFEFTKQPEHDWGATIRIFSSSMVRVNWQTDAFETPEQLRWLKRRLDQAYWQVDERRGIAYRFHALMTRVDRFFLNRKRTDK